MANDIILQPPGVPTEKDKQEMSRLLQIMGNDSPPHPQATFRDRPNMGNQQPPPRQQRSDYYSSPSDPIVSAPFTTNEDVKHMASILERFYSITDETAEMLVEESKTVPEVRRAIITEKTETGVRVGKWEIRVRLDESRRKATKYYSVVQAGSGTMLAEDLMLFEAADLLVKYFNEGKTVTSKEVMDVLRFEEKFSVNWNDAVRFRRASQKHLSDGDRKAAEIFEARYDKAKDEALMAKNTIKRLYEGR